MDGKKVSISPGGEGDLVHLERGALHLFLDPEAPNWASTNKTGAEIMEKMGSSSKEEIAKEMAKKWGINLDHAVRDCEEFLHTLKDIQFPLDKSDNSIYPGRGSLLECGKLEELWIYTNVSCNLRCSHCFVSAGGSGKDELSTDEIKALVREAESLGAFRFYLTGGEPFLRKDIFELIRYVLRDGKNQLIVLSNGTLLDKETVSGLKPFRKKNLNLQISIEGPNKETNDFIRGKGSFERAVKGIKNLVKIGVAPIVTTTVTKKNLQEILQIPDLLHPLGVKNLHVLWLHNRGRAKDRADLLIDAAKLKDTMRRLLRKSKKMGIVVDNEISYKARVRSKRGRKQDLCNSCYEMLSVDSNGDVYPCAPLNGETSFLCGSVRKGSLREIWEESKMAKAVRELSVSKKEDCRACDLRYICGGGCFCQSYYAGKRKDFEDVYSTDPYCNTHRELIYDVLWDLSTPGKIRQVDGYEKPVIYRSMEERLPTCAVPSKRVKDFSFEVGTFHCSCVLAIDNEEGDNALRSNGHRQHRDACFNELAHEYEDWLISPIGEAYDELAKEAVFESIKIREGEHILDAGCGTANYSLNLAKLGARVVGADASEWMLRIGIKNARRENLNIDFKHAELENLPFQDESFDSVLCVNVLEFSEDPQSAMKEIFSGFLRREDSLSLECLTKGAYGDLQGGSKRHLPRERIMMPDSMKLKRSKIYSREGTMGPISQQQYIYLQ